MLALSSSALSYAPVVPAQLSRSAVRCDAPLMTEDSSYSRRDLFARAAAGVAGLSAVQGASAKAGQFSKLDIFSIAGQPAISSPYQPGGPQGGGPGTTYGYKKSDGPILADGYKNDVSREKASFDISAKIISSQEKNIDKKTWWLVRDNLRGQAYNMKQSMKALNYVATDQAAVTKAYKKFWSEIDQLDLACVKKELDLAKKEYADVLAALDAYTALI